MHVRRSNDTIGLSLPFPEPGEGSRPGPKLPVDVQRDFGSKKLGKVTAAEANPSLPDVH